MFHEFDQKPNKVARIPAGRSNAIGIGILVQAVTSIPVQFQEPLSIHTPHPGACILNGVTGRVHRCIGEAVARCATSTGCIVVRLCAQRALSPESALDAASVPFEAFWTGTCAVMSPM